MSARSTGANCPLRYEIVLHHLGNVLRCRARAVPGEGHHGDRRRVIHPLGDLDDQLCAGPAREAQQHQQAQAGHGRKAGNGSISNVDPRV
jgi:hypothetical protein